MRNCSSYFLAGPKRRPAYYTSQNDKHGFLYSFFERENCFFCLELLFYFLCLSISQAGSISGTVVYKWPLPHPIENKVDRDDEFCEKKRIRQLLRIHTTSKGVQGAVVRLQFITSLNHNSQGQGPITTNHDRTFTPHIVTTRVNEFLEIRSEDPILHNTHIRNLKKTFINVALVVDGLPIRKRIKKPGVMSVECDAHKFMQASMLAFDPPFYNMTNTTGSFQITEVHPGKHALGIWHEFLGPLTVPIDVPHKRNISVIVEHPFPWKRPIQPSDLSSCSSAHFVVAVNLDKLTRRCDRNERLIMLS